RPCQLAWPAIKSRPDREAVPRRRFRAGDSHWRRRIRAMIKFGVGQSVKRGEDVRLLTGAGQYTDAISLPRQAYAYFLPPPSPHAHADIGTLDTGAAKTAPGVLGVFTGADIRAAGLGDLQCAVPLRNRDGSAMFMPPRPALAVGRVRFVGDPVAMVVAETL